MQSIVVSVWIVFFVVGEPFNENDASGAGDEDIANGELARQWHVIVISRNGAK